MRTVLGRDVSDELQALKVASVGRSRQTFLRVRFIVGSRNELQDTGNALVGGNERRDSLGTSKAASGGLALHITTVSTAKAKAADKSVRPT